MSTPYDAEWLEYDDDSRSSTVLVAFGCYECLRPHDGPVGLSECPFCGGLTGTMPAEEQPTPAARDAVLAWEAEAAS